MKFFIIISNFADRVNSAVGYLTSWITTLLVVVVSYDVFTRYVLKNSSVAVQELEWHLFALIFLLGAGYTLKLDNHVRVDVLYSRFTPKAKALVNLVGSLVFLLPFCVLVIKTSVPFIINSYHFHEVSPDPGGLPNRWMLKSVISIGFGLLFLQGLALASRSLLTLAGSRQEDNNG
ncbi:Tripartite ATP-independent periplasmic transporter DctQ component [Denitrovibrio acetiphilus DSM 12809]|uniref:Tripartite ATP-independent periplasmic transporter DctQ component n=1 Tax=Denitrovibrio acetiphilus (strain DSM 12809 / NBRC 114555 / N2460) TaxID=522772 RepID=D4H1Q5_DENA2|nr:TRAP transporter small permease subunit [Denitrovibrio acetiphilus]ADD68815.1 Tripartite ATP-independent periplasmic transporter DctQ component [Denitrovibrio acetiphilus DSM 12809]